MGSSKGNQKNVTGLPVYVLIHSPLVGRLTWEPVARQMQARNLEVAVPSLIDEPDSNRPYWQQHAVSVSRALVRLAENQRLVLVAHSGAGPLLPAVRQFLAHPIAAYIFVDAGMPQDGFSRLDLMEIEDPAWASQLRQELLADRRFPSWSAEQLSKVIPDPDLRRRMAAELQPRGLDFFSEPIPVFTGWPDAPCAYLWFSEPYAQDAAQARQAGWLLQHMPAGHFHMLVDPAKVADIMITLTAQAMSK
jgi:hypothetical protein